jgi:hypothetical protein
LTVSEIFERVHNHQCDGVCTHDDLVEYFGFLSLNGFREMQMYQLFSENAEKKHIQDYYMKHYNQFIKQKEESESDFDSVIPTDWLSHTRFDVDKSTKARGVKNAFELWKEWETESKAVYQKAYSDLTEIGEIAAAEKIKELVTGVDDELAMIDTYILSMRSIDYDMVEIYDMQDTIERYYRKKLKKIGKEIVD